MTNFDSSFTAAPDGAQLDTLPESADDLQAVLRVERRQLKASIEELGGAIQDTVNVRKQLRERPLIVVGAAFAAGVALGLISSHRSNGTVSQSAGDAPSASEGHPLIRKAVVSVAGVAGRRLLQAAEDRFRKNFAHSS